MKYFVLFVLVSFGCLVYLVSSVDWNQLKTAAAPTSITADQDSETSLTSASIRDGRDPASLEFQSGSSPKLVLMKFGAPWCPPCRMIDKELVKLERGDLPVEIRKINVDERPELAERYHVTSIPRLILLQDGRKVGDLVGYKSSKELTRWITEEASESALAGKKPSQGPSVVHANPFFK